MVAPVDDLKMDKKLIPDIETFPVFCSFETVWKMVAPVGQKVSSKVSLTDVRSLLRVCLVSVSFSKRYFGP